MKILIDIGKDIVPRGQTVPVQMVFVESDVASKSAVLSGIVRAYLMSATDFLTTHAAECPTDAKDTCEALLLHSDLVAALKPIVARYNG